MRHQINVLLFTCLVGGISSCDRNDPEPNSLVLLNSSSWLGAVEREVVDYDHENNIANKTTTTTPEGQRNLTILNADGTGVVSYLCDETSCNGDEYEARWSLTNHILRITLNREQFNSLADHEYIEANIVRITTTELILEKTTYVGVAPSTTKRIIRTKYISIE